MFFGLSREERRLQVAERAKEERLRRTLLRRWAGIAPMTSLTGVQVRLDSAEKRLALLSESRLIELGGECVLDAWVVTFDGPAQAPELATSEGVPVGTASATAGRRAVESGGSPKRPVSMVVRVSLQMREFEVLDFPIWSRRLDSKPSDDEIGHAFARAEGLVRRFLSVR